MKKIIFTVINDLTYDQRMQKTCTSLSAAGHEVWLIGRKLAESLPLRKQPFTQHRLRCIFTKGKLFYLEYNLRLLFFLMRQQSDIFAAVDLDTMLPNLVAAKIKNAKLVYDAHEYFPEVPEVIHRPLVKAFWLWVEKYCIPKTDLRYTVSTSLSSIFKEKYHLQFGVIRNVPVKDDKKFHTPANSLAGKFIIYQGALNRGRGLESLILAMKKINMPLKFAGEGDLSQYLRDLVHREQLDHKVQFLGFVPPESLNEVTEEAFIGYNLLENQGQSYYYSLANKFFSYIHAGVPNLSPLFPEYLEINKRFEVSMLTDPEPDNISMAVNFLIDNKKVYQRLKANCEKARAEFNWQNEEEKLLKWYEEL